MNLRIVFFIVALSGVSLNVSSQVQCVVDVTINEGGSIQMCANALETLTASSGFVSYAWTGPESLSGQSITPSFTGQYTVSATDGVGCISTAIIDVGINPIPVDAIISSEGDTLCPGIAGTTLSVSGTYLLVNWGGGNIAPTNFVTTGGTYSVSVADANSCVANFNITIEQPVFTITAASDLSCNAQASTLVATGGASYLWSTGEITSSIVVTPASTTVYSVQITEGKCSQVLTTTVGVSEIEPFEMPDTLYIGDGESVFVSGPPDYQSYYWYPTNQIDDSTGAGINFNGPETQTIFLEATIDEGCVLYDRVHIIVVRLTIPTGFSPNSDAMNDTFVIPELDTLKGELIVWNRWGDIVYETKNYGNDWDGTCQSQLCLGNDTLPEGTYFYTVNVYGVIFKGYLTIKK